MIVKSSFRRINIFSPEEICNFKFLVGFQTYFSYIVKHSWKLLEMAQSHQWDSQGLILGLILFVKFINDLLECILSEVLCFTNDTKLFSDIRTEDDVETLQHDLNNLFDWNVE